MSFYYPSIFSFIFIAVLYAVLLGMVWLVWVKLAKRRFKGPAAWGVVALVLVAPWLEEFWIAWHFGQLCRKDAGIFVSKVVEVEGFYDDTTHWWRQLAESGYQFVESRDNTYGGLYRVEKNGTELKHFKIDRPTARHHFFTDSGSDIGHKLARQESKVVNSENGELVGQYRVYIRGAPWFYIGLDRPNMGCDGADGGPRSKHKNSFLIYRDVLIPSKSSQGEEK